MRISNLWILTEERPKDSVLRAIIEKFALDNRIGIFISDFRIIPILDRCCGNFTFYYRVVGVCSHFIKNIYIRNVSGSSSFVDFLVFFQELRPNPLVDIPLYIIEETKTDDSESRNTGIYQRASKFVYASSIFPNARKIMLYSLQISQKDTLTQTNIFGTRCLMTLGVEILGKRLDENLCPFYSVEELIAFKENMRKAPKNNTPINIVQYNNKITISGRLSKNNSLSHDPNIGALSLISATIRRLGYLGEIEIISHDLSQEYIKNDNKFIRVANILNIQLENLTIPRVLPDRNDYWHYESSGEKLATIFLHLAIEHFTTAKSIYENHAGCERGYFFTPTGEAVAVKKYEDRDRYKSGDRSAKIAIPDLVISDIDRSEIINIEGKQFIKVNVGLKELNDFDAFEKIYISHYYPNARIIRSLVLFGGSEDEYRKLVSQRLSQCDSVKIGFVLSENGKMILQTHSPEIFKEALRNLYSFYGLNFLDTFAT
ncbi:hypothetical protein LJN47_00290 [Helicobacter pylori]|uniref:hypothetical protein n=1 Tax=Helicobacter pylori TaxID=210 RepID=UPI001E320B40|nr:hypothetical protein [Helicobacter pylori]UFG20112.1 hypothetical protein LJN47_00290 [Helicobacter pylori]